MYTLDRNSWSKIFASRVYVNAWNTLTRHFRVSGRIIFALFYASTCFILVFFILSGHLEPMTFIQVQTVSHVTHVHERTKKKRVFRSFCFFDALLAVLLNLFCSYYISIVLHLPSAFGQTGVSKHRRFRSGATKHAGCSGYTLCLHSSRGFIRI